MSIKAVTVAVTGASGAPYFIQLLRCLFAAEVRVFLLLSTAAKVVIKTELNLDVPDNDKDLKSFFIDYFSISDSSTQQAKSFLNPAEGTLLAKGSLLEVYGKEEWTASVASGSNPANAMVVCPCSMGTLSAIAHGASNNLLERAADVMLKERKQLILLTREMPLSSIHLENMLKLSQLGVTIMPASPGFYHQPKTVDDLVKFVVARILDHLGVKQSLISRWG